MSETMRRRLTRSDVRSALVLVGHREATFSDVQSKGLALRVRKASATWCLRARLGDRQTTWRIADAREMEDPEEARAAAAEAWRLIRRGIDPEERLREIENGGPVERHFDKARDGWTWEEGVDAFLKEMETGRARATARFYRHVLKSEHLSFLDGKLLKQVTPQDGKRAQDEIHGRGYAQMARKTLQAMQTFMKWAANRHGSGIEFSPVAGVQVRPLSRHEQPAEGYLPTLQELGRLPWRLEAADIAPQARLAALLILLTAQRVETIISARREHFEAIASGGLWNIPWRSMKSKRPHVIPLPPSTWDVVTQAMALAGDRPWLFPQVRPRRKGGPAEGHISYHPVADPMAPLDPHDVRRAFATHGEALLGNANAETKAILDHAEGRSGDVTASRYALHDGTHFKWAVMRRWEDWILGLAVKHAAVPGARMRSLRLPTDG